MVGCLDMMLTSSEPGAEMHHLHVVAAPAGEVGPLGVVAKAKLEVSVYAIAAQQGSGPDPEQFTEQVIVAAALDHHRKGKRVLFAALSQEVWAVEPWDQLAVELRAQRRLSEHPNMAEATTVYGACADGRRWASMRWLTGPQAGEKLGMDLLVGAPQRGEGGPQARLVRRLVGLSQ